MENVENLYLKRNHQSVGFAIHVTEFVVEDALLLPDDSEPVLKELDRMKSKPHKGPAPGEKWLSQRMGIAEKRVPAGRCFLLFM